MDNNETKHNGESADTLTVAINLVPSKVSVRKVSASFTGSRFRRPKSAGNVQQANPPEKYNSRSTDIF
jgi:hypothetical protein